MRQEIKKRKKERKKEEYMSSTYTFNFPRTKFQSRTLGARFCFCLSREDFVWKNNNNKRTRRKTK